MPEAYVHIDPALLELCGTTADLDELGLSITQDLGIEEGGVIVDFNEAESIARLSGISEESLARLQTLGVKHGEMVGEMTIVSENEAMSLTDRSGE